MGIMNGCTEGDGEVDFTYIGAKNETMIDYIIMGEKGKEKMEVVESVDLDHMKLVVTWENEEEEDENEIEKE